MMEQLIRQFSLEPHPEGGYFRETMRSAATLPGGTRSLCTAIYYLLPAGQHSRLHRLDADELWHFYRGDPLIIVELQPGAAASLTRLSVDHPQHLVRGGTWFGALPAPGGSFSLVGCTVSPGFVFEQFELGAREALTREFPRARDVIAQLTPAPV